jgi:hypothetical protein
MQGTILLAILNVTSSYSRNVERAVEGGADVPDTVQWWIGEQTWRIRTFGLDHDIHPHMIAGTGPELLEFALQNNAKHYAELTAAQHVLRLVDCTDPVEVAKVCAGAGLPPRLEVAAGRFAFWKPDDAKYRSQTQPK